MMKKTISSNFPEYFTRSFRHGLLPAWVGSLEQACPVFLWSPGSGPALEPPANRHGHVIQYP